MRKILLAISATFLFGATSQAADVLCTCSGEQTCTDIEINFVPSNPGVYMTIKYAYGDMNKEGFATVKRTASTGETIYAMGGFILVEKDNKYSLPGKLQDCNGTN